MINKKTLNTVTLLFVMSVTLGCTSLRTAPETIVEKCPPKEKVSRSLLAEPTEKDFPARLKKILSP